MKLRQEFIEHYGDTEKYDLPAFLMQEISEEFIKNPIDFIGSYIDPVFEDPSRAKYKEFRSGIRDEVYELRRKKRIDFEEIKKIIFAKLIDFEEPAGDALDNARSICMFLAMLEVDDFIRCELEELRGKKETPNYANGNGPLNSRLPDSPFAVYLKERDSFLEKANIPGGEDSLRTQLFTRDIGERLFATHIIEKRSLPTDIIPRIVQVHPEEVREDLEKIRIAIIPFISFDTFRFHEKNSADPVKPQEKKVKGAFYVDYSDSEEYNINNKENTKRAVDLLNEAIKGKANVVIFPEYVMSPMMRRGIEERLDTLNKTEKSSLWLVFAGTTYEYDSNTGKGNNILYILSNGGKELGKYYKYAPYTVDKGNSAENKERGYIGISCNEILSDRGKEICLVDVPKIGRILPAVCRDATELNYTRIIADVFHPSLQVIPAWSKSVASFDSGMLYAANTQHTASVLCNCCNAVGYGEEKKRAAIVKVCIPEMDESRMVSAPKSLRMRTEICCRECLKGKRGCVYYADIDISEVQPKCNEERTVLDNEAVSSEK